MPKEASSAHDIRAQLTAVGYKVVQTNAPIGSNSHVRADAIAWATDSEGSLVPWAVIEVKNGSKAHKVLALQELIRARDLLGTVDHYAVINGKWFKADRGLRHLEQVDGPTAPEHGAGGFLTDRNLATSLVLDRLAYDEQAHSRAGTGGARAFPITNVMAETLMPGIDVPGVGFVPVAPDILWKARRDALVRWASRSSKDAPSASEPVIARAVATLTGNRLGGVVLDPFCGTGSFLWESLDRALTREYPTEFIGFEFNENLAALASQIGRAAPLRSNIEQRDSFSGVLPDCDVIVTAPPLGLRLNQARQLSSGSSTKDSTLAAIDLCVQTLRPGGRAVLHLPSSITYSASGAHYRQFLAHTYRVTALIGLPSGAIMGTGIRSVLMVIDKTEPGDTFVAQLGEDWSAQLAPTGAALEAALSHIAGLSSEG